MNVLIADLQRDQLRNAPVFKEGEPVVVIGAASAAPKFFDVCIGSFSPPVVCVCVLYKRKAYNGITTS